MAEHPIQDLMNVTMDKIRQMVDSNTIVGKPITTEDGITILPVSKVSFGFASGGTDFDGKNPCQQGPVRRRLRRGCQHSACGVSGRQGWLRAHHPAVRQQQHGGPRPDHDPRTGGKGQRPPQQKKKLPPPRRRKSPAVTADFQPAVLIEHVATCVLSAGRRTRSEQLWQKNVFRRS